MSSAFDLLFTNQTFFNIFGAPVTYSRGASEVVVTAMDSIFSAEQQLQFGASLTQEAREFVIAIEDLELSGRATEPAKGDAITDSNSHIWEVRSVAGQPAWEYDIDRNYYRVRAVHVGVAAPVELTYVVDSNGDYLITSGGDRIII